ncbi:MAG TPA: NAD(P)-dependent oxidoreductase [Burkholderiales bacterium]|jgi:nucleoside-diphosphate-sugar epimerase|nr:NAD(P)-dependent oxidoreductase [Burkholderiales bacterium]
MKTLVTGGAGFLGREFLRQMRAAGRETVSTDRSGAVDFPGDLSDPAFCATLPDAGAVVHCAAVQYLSPDLPLLARTAYFRRNNIEATACLAQRYADKATHFVFVGSSMMYAQSGAASYAPDSPMRAQGVYSASKLAAFEHVKRLPNRWAAVLPCIIAGPGRGGLFRPFARSIARFSAAVFPGRGAHPVHMVHVEDAASLLVRVVAEGATGVFNAASPGPLSIDQWVDTIAEELGVHRVRRLRVPLAPIRWLSAATGFRLLAAEQLLMLRYPHVLGVERSIALGWQPRRDNKEILRETVRALLRGDINANQV